MDMTTNSHTGTAEWLMLLTLSVLCASIGRGIGTVPRQRRRSRRPKCLIVGRRTAHPPAIDPRDEGNDMNACGEAVADLPRATGLSLEGDRLSRDAQEGATGYNIHLDYDYFDTVRGTTSYTVTEPGRYHVISYNDDGEFGVTRNPDEAARPYIFVEYAGSNERVSCDSDSSVLVVTRTCTNVGPGETCIENCPSSYETDFGSVRNVAYLSGGACSTSDIVEADALASRRNYRCTVPTFSGEVTAQAICVAFR